MASDNERDKFSEYLDSLRLFSPALRMLLLDGDYLKITRKQKLQLMKFITLTCDYDRREIFSLSISLT